MPFAAGCEVRRGLCSLILIWLTTLNPNLPSGWAHDHTVPQFLMVQRERAAQADAQAAASQPDEPVCRLTVQLTDAATQSALDGSLRITRLDDGKAVPLTSHIHRQQHWYSIPATVALSVPRTKLKIEALHGVETLVATQEVDLTRRASHVVKIPLSRFYRPRDFGLVSGNTHLHLMRMTYAEAMQYLDLVPRSDGLDLVFLSHLRRAEAERLYISNEIVENALLGRELERLNRSGVVFGLGQEHRHNFGAGGEGYGHVMFLDTPRLLHPISIGPGIMGTGSDAPPLRTGIDRARQDGATIIWCHDRFGYEDLPNWLAGRLDAVNMHDGGVHGTYAESFYRYLNLGERVPFSTGTDWFLYDFSRVYVPLEPPLTTTRWLTQLKRGTSYITNGTFLEFQVAGETSGATLSIPATTPVPVRGRALGRNPFKSLELIWNGEIRATAAAELTAENIYVAELDLTLPIDSSGWLALRIPPDAGRNEFDQTLFAHTSPVYVEFAGRRHFQPEVARDLLAEMQRNLEDIERQGRFDSDAERNDVFSVHREGIRALELRLKTAQRLP